MLWKRVSGSGRLYMCRCHQSKTPSPCSLSGRVELLVSWLKPHMVFHRSFPEAIFPSTWTSSSPMYRMVCRLSPRHDAPVLKPNGFVRELVRIVEGSSFFVLLRGCLSAVSVHCHVHESSMNTVKFSNLQSWKCGISHTRRSPLPIV